VLVKRGCGTELDRSKPFPLSTLVQVILSMIFLSILSDLDVDVATDCSLILFRVWVVPLNCSF
jgi:hypothetical protein